MALADDLLFEETERPTMAEFNERLGTIGEKLDTAAFLNALKTAVVDGEGNELLSIPGVQIETGSYTGTGTYGSSNPNSLTFGFEPKVVFIYGYSGYPSFPAVFIRGTTRFIPFAYGNGDFTAAYYCVCTWNGNTVQWYTSNTSSYAVNSQLNGNGYIYYYVALG